MANTLGYVNPLRYRGYYYDVETELYYLQSRYYDPVIGRFINADAYTSTGQGILGNNMFAYCRNNPVIRKDSCGTEDVEKYWDDGSDGTVYNEPIDPDDAAPVHKSPTVGTTGGGTGGSNTTGYGRAPKTSTPGSKYTQVSSDGRNAIVSETTYDKYGMPSQRIDYAGGDHGVGLPHIHEFSNGMARGAMHRLKETIRRYWGDGGTEL